MKILHTRIRNFKRLRNFDMDFSGQNSNLAFVNGTNGNGKSSLLNAYRWCFFGEPITTEHFAYAELSTLKPGDASKIIVEVRLLVNNMGDYANVVREQNVECVLLDETLGVAFDGPEKLSVTLVYANAQIPSEVIPEPKSWLESNLPQRFKRFILFDGELMYKFFDLSVKGAIEDAVREIAKIDLFDEVVSKVQELQNKINQKIAKLSGSAAEKIQVDLERAIKSHSDYGVGLRLKRNERDDYLAGISDLRDALRGKEDLERFLAENKELRSALDLQLKRRADLDATLSKLLLFTGVNNLIISRTKYPLTKQVQDAEKNGRYPADFSSEALVNLLAQHSCICGRELSDGSIEAKHVHSIIEISKNSGSIGIELKKIEMGMAMSEGMVAQAQHDSHVVLDSLKDATREIVRLQRAINDLQPQLSGVRGNHEELLELSRRLKRLENDLATVTREEATMTLRHGQLWEEVQSLEKKFEKARGNSSEVRRLDVRAKFLGRALEQASQFSEEIIRKVRVQLQDAIATKFSRVQGCEGLKVILSDDFEISVTNEMGKSPELSEGQKMALAYLFSIGIREVVGLSFPLIVDTPIGRVSTLNRTIIADALRNLVSGDSDHQVILMMHDGEYSPYTQKDFASSKPLETYLALSEDRLESTLCEGIDPDWLTRDSWKDWAEGNIKP